VAETDPRRNTGFIDQYNHVPKADERVCLGCDLSTRPIRWNHCPPLAGTARVMALTFSGDGAYLASSSLDGTIKLRQVRSGQEVRTLQKSGNEAIVNEFALSPNGHLLASADTI
jgi:WD40 repeat protein